MVAVVVALRRSLNKDGDEEALSGNKLFTGLFACDSFQQFEFVQGNSISQIFLGTSISAYEFRTDLIILAASLNSRYP